MQLLPARPSTYKQILTNKYLQTTKGEIMGINEDIIDRLERRLARYYKEVRAKALAEDAKKYKQLTIWNESHDGIEAPIVPPRKS